MPIKHSFQSARADNDDAGDIQPSQWNADHVLTGLLALIDQVAPTPNSFFTLDAGGNPQLKPLADFIASLLASPAFTGNPTAPTPAAGDNDASLATTAFVQNAIAALVASAPGTLDTLNELATALGDDPNFATTMTNALAAKAPLASPGFSGTPTAPTPGAADNSTKLATTAFIVTALAAYAKIASPTFTGTPAAPTPTAGDNSTKLATTAFVQTAVSAISGAFGQCRLTKSGANIVLSPFRGNLLTIAGVACTVPDAGVSLAPTGLTAGTLYYIYATQSGGAVNALEASTTAYVVDTTAGNKGVAIKTGDNTRTLVGMVRPIAGPAFADTLAQRFVRSWFNRLKPNMVASFSANRTTTSTAFVELNTEIRTEFLVWADETISYGFSGFGFHSAANDYFIVGITFDGGTTPNAYGATFGANGAAVPCTTMLSNFAEGYHFASIVGRVATGGTGTIQFAPAGAATLAGAII